MKIEDIKYLSLWEGDRIMHRLLEEDAGVFSLKLVYDEEDRLLEHELLLPCNK